MKQVMIQFRPEDVSYIAQCLQCGVFWIRETAAELEAIWQGHLDITCEDEE